ncbi:MAG: YcxB family protein [Evtepia sp.]|uniref:YcxB family protein n=1 Tax=Evtepia sp. TaxID=2773933 RepID=UPI002A74D6AE|nr:YcxB family protein [Evtepia sp.]MDY3014391.1 YcxB family protein [Evtepia sp.]
MDESFYPFVNQTTYNRDALAALNRLAEASVRKEKSRRTRALCYLLGVVGLVAGSYCYQSQTLVGTLLLIYGVLLLLVAITWKSFQLRSSQRQLQQGVRTCTYEFDEDELICHTEAGELHYPYDQVYAVVGDKDWYAIFFDSSHGVVLDKKGFTAGDPMAFKAFIGQHTQLPIQKF